MQAAKLENSTDMPAELVGRATRILFRIGNDVLPRSPSLAEIGKMPRFNALADVTAAIGPGQFSDMESNSVLNVQNQGGGNTFPSFPSLGASSNPNFPPASPPSGGLLTDLADQTRGGAQNVIDQARAAAEQLSAGSNQGLNGNSSNPAAMFQQGARGAPGASVPTLPSVLPNVSNQSATPLAPPAFPQSPTGAAPPGSGVPTKFENAPPPETLQDSSRTRTGTQNWQAGADPRTASDRYADSYANSLQNPANPYDPRTQSPLGNPTTNYTGITPQRTPSSGFGSTPQQNLPSTTSPPGYNNYATPGGYQTPQYGNPYGQSGFTSETQNQANLGAGYSSPLTPNSNYPNANDGIQRVATNNSIPANVTTTNDAPTTNSVANRDNSASPSDNKQVTDPRTDRSKSSEGILQVFFLLSLVVNFYLGMLIRKLLTRYRSLLANMRGQTA
jgi:hypothetical protein